ncbi:helix-turn-helix domain-containing protein [Streptomyces clavuligerus]|nr:helix-turn-helix transcriptional regulator [Streptomyces clavuligerus]MBY6304084.1 helix-turn-helix transcriptional regulator [Streptomyces clavuligerus]QPL64132.1 helix-turn-helix transcriptional regulator [Streptomyces clavuligerus]QPL70161.1 helix-turn-helix transcriptional regulator [Streptomyces clavuligerus]QPL76244.1 helix-turn-helix transcriptional regulator [Streptomyces clavuligerus]QPL82270.1 helix-turn-helix transcriptional regulator [Streptomyces clavuligerus]
MPYELEEQEAIGRRIKRRRLALGMPQADLGAAVGQSQGWVSKVEKGRIELDRAALINSIAAALHCHPNDLIDRPYVGTAPENQWQPAAASILRELRRYDLTPVFDGTPRPSGTLWQDMRRLHRLRDAAANVAILRSLPDLLREAQALAEVAAGHEREEAFGIYAVCCKFAHTAAHALGHPELVAMACERAVWASRLSGDPVLPAVADWMRIWDMWATASWADCLALADKALGGIEREYERGDALAVRAWGSLQLRAAVSAARAGNAGEADHRIGLARQAATRLHLPESATVEDRHSLTFSAGNVTIHGISVALELSDQTTALRRNEQAGPEEIAALPNSRQGHHRMDLARAWLWEGDRHKALGELRQAEALAPQLVRNHPIARATLRRIIHAERTATHEQLRGMANRFHLNDQELFS